MISLSGFLPPLMKRSNGVDPTDVAIELPGFAKLNPTYMLDFFPQIRGSFEAKCNLRINLSLMARSS